MRKSSAGVAKAGNRAGRLYTLAAQAMLPPPSYPWGRQATHVLMRLAKVLNYAQTLDPTSSSPL